MTQSPPPYTAQDRDALVTKAAMLTLSFLLIVAACSTSSPSQQSRSQSDGLDRPDVSPPNEDVSDVQPAVIADVPASDIRTSTPGTRRPDRPSDARPSGIVNPDPLPAQQLNGLRRELAENRSKWDSASWKDYDFRYSQYCYPCTVVLVVKVRDGVISELRDPFTGELVTNRRAGTIDSIFVRLQAILDYGPSKYVVEYDAELGYPRIGDVDVLKDAIDDEYVFEAEIISLLEK